MKVKLKSIYTKDGRKFNLNINQIYEVIGIECDDYRLLSDIDDNRDGNKPYIYDREYFEIIENKEPEFWETEFGEDGEKYSYPKEIGSIGFFEDFHDGKEESIKIFWEIIKEKYPGIWKERSNYVKEKYKK